ncbi:MAG TPA: MoaD/ThiS family protein [Rhizomicrobium sp.]|nr:MoaD/ThiS family protein [Rhizomicrobium sp.]
MTETASNDSGLVTILIASPLRPYTGKSEVQARGATLAELLADLDRRYPGIRFRMVDEQDKIRRHIRLFVDGEQVFDLSRPLRPADEVCIVQALSGG